jgi:peptidoglycan hydrolase-like protein with peptidoglycan-binding domain
VVKAIQQRMGQLGIADFDGTGQFGPKTEQAICLFQARRTDAQGAFLAIDGELGSH